MAISNHYQSESLLELSVAASGLRPRDGLRNCIPISFCVNTGSGQFMALTSEEGHSPGEIFWPSPDRSVDNFDISPMRMHHFLSGNNFAAWLCKYADQLSRNCYPVIENEIYKFLFSGTMTTKGITVTTTTAFLPELSSVKPPLFFFTYRISISMDPEGSLVGVNYKFFTLVQYTLYTTSAHKDRKTICKWVNPHPSFQFQLGGISILFQLLKVIPQYCIAHPYCA